MRAGGETARLGRGSVGGFGEARRPNCLERAHPPPPPGSLGCRGRSPPIGTIPASKRKCHPAVFSRPRLPTRTSRQPSSYARQKENHQTSRPVRTVHPFPEPAPINPRRQASPPRWHLRAPAVPPPPPPPASEGASPMPASNCGNFRSFSSPSAGEAPISPGIRHVPTRATCFTPPTKSTPRMPSVARRLRTNRPEHRASFKSSENRLRLRP